MFGKRQIEVENIDNVHIRFDSHPFGHHQIEYLLAKVLDSPNEPFIRRGLPTKETRHRWVRYLNIAATAISAISGLALLVLVVLIVAGKSSIGAVTISTLLTVFSTSLIGSLLSIGGVTLFSITADLKKMKDKVAPTDCPFEDIQSDNDVRRPGNPEFCVKCPLGIDINGNVEGYLMHRCSVYMDKHSSWKRTPEAIEVLERRGW